MGLQMILMQVLLFVGVILIIPAAPADAQALPGCDKSCGNVKIPYPFGINSNCYRDANFRITCDTDNTTGLLTPKTGNLSVQSISVEEGQLRVQLPISKVCYDEHSGKPLNNTLYDRTFSLSNFTISNGTNTFVTVGCDTTALLLGSRNNVIDFTSIDFTSCFTTCDEVDLKTVEDGSCSGVGCCQVEVAKEFKDLTVYVSPDDNQTDNWGLGFIPCSYAFLVEKGKFNFSHDYLQHLPYEDFPVMLDWSIRNQTCEEAKNKPDYACHGNTECHNVSLGYRCLCYQGYQGNPYYPQGCKDIDECADPNLNKCIESKSCVNTEGSYTCSCPERTHGDGKFDGEGCVPLPHQRPRNQKPRNATGEGVPGYRGNTN